MMEFEGLELCAVPAWEGPGDGCKGIRVADEGVGAALGIGGPAMLESDSTGFRTTSNPVPSDRSSSVPSPSLNLPSPMACIRRVSEAKSLMEEAIDFEISHGEKALQSVSSSKGKLRGHAN